MNRATYLFNIQFENHYLIKIQFKVKIRYLHTSTTVSNNWEQEDIVH